MDTCKQNAQEDISAGSGDVRKLVLKAGRSKEYTVVVPPNSLTIRDIQKQIPAKYFERSTRRSLLYLLRDLVQLFLTYAVMYTILLPIAAQISTALLNTATAFNSHNENNNSIMSVSLQAIATTVSWLMYASLWCTFWFVQGLNATALWVLAHECGHHAFSPRRWLNEAIGMILHTALLVPYQSWRLTHATHHKHTNHLSKDLVFVPPHCEPNNTNNNNNNNNNGEEKQHHNNNNNEKINQKDGNGEDHVMYRNYAEFVEDTPVAVLFGVVRMLLFGWPAHLICNAGGQPRYGAASHFNPHAPFFRPADAPAVAAAALAVALAVFILVLASLRWGFLAVLMWYGVPYLCVNAWLVYITYMQHSDIRLPHYNHAEWTFLRGAVAAVDRDYGSLINAWLHHINDSHVVHHLFSMMPHYHAIVVTRRYIREILGDMYITDERPLWKSLVHTWRECRYVVPSDGVCVYRS
ncbi:putative fatty acid desaturase [Trypanosoma theileri]|uniref:Putative fatty acid desaturase n=1 Tax=Trypanosoma theileri TaxID=67003 RepID=A0A1X0NKF1_9TRYP|nr:putative fatty acid desaturase [Trypanosoma theileri]ORC84933.1 putative fatty acid desaturase [Trypanosoma theileri]